MLSAQACFWISLREQGTEIARGRFSYPEGEELFATLAENSRRWLREQFFPQAREVYLADKSPSKRFYFKRFDYTFAFTEREGILHLAVTLSRGGTTLAVHEEELIYHPAERQFAPPAKRKGKG